MSRPANPYDNATCESFLETLKREEIHAGAYRDFEDLQGQVEKFMDRYYNGCRLHSALRYSSREEFQTRVEGTSPAAGVTFSGGF
jgi:putative transposase